MKAVREAPGGSLIEVRVCARSRPAFEVTGEHIVTVKYGETTNWAKGIRENGSPDPNPEKEATIPGSLVSPVEGGVTNWQPWRYSPSRRCCSVGRWWC